MRNLWRWVALAIAALLLLTYLERFVLVGLLATRITAPLLAAIASAVAIAGTGFLARGRRPGLLLDFAVGYPIFGTICFLVGSLKINSITMTIVILSFAVAGGLACVREWTDRRQAVTDTRELPDENESTAARTFAAFAVALVLLCGFVAAQAPPSTLDEVAYHLAVPHAWVTEGRAVELPLISHSYFPLGVESADLPSLALLGPIDGGVASHLLHLFAALATTLLLFRRARSWLVTAAIVATPALALTAGWSLVDWPLLAVCIAFLDDDEPTRRAALAAGLLTKYTFLPFAAIAIVVTRRWRGLWPGAIAGSVFFVRNLILTGNPLAPFLASNAPHVGGYRSPLTLASYIFDGRFIDESLGASLLALLPTIAGPLALALALAGALFWATAPSARLLVPFFASAATAARLRRSRALHIVIALAIAAQLLLVVYFVDRTSAFSLMTAKSSEDDYLTHARPSYAAIKWVDGLLPPDSRTLVVGLNETYWFSHRVRGGGNFDGPRISAYLDVPTPDALLVRLRRDGITHVAVFSVPPQSGVAQKVEERQTRLTPGAQRTLAEMLDRDAATVTSRGNDVLFALR